METIKKIKVIVTGIIVVLSILFCVLAAVASFGAQADEFDVKAFLNKTYVTVGAGYKFHEPKLRLHLNGEYSRWSEPLSARIEIGYYINSNIKVGVSHHSQWLTGFPIDETTEYYKTEIFIDATMTLGEIYEWF